MPPDLHRGCIVDSLKIHLTHPSYAQHILDALQFHWFLHLFEFERILKMRSILIASLLFNFVFIAYLMNENSTLTPSVNAGPVPAAGENGDVDGDSNRNLGDVLYLLNYLFRGGPAPVEISCPDATPIALPQTGQNACFNDLGEEVLCNNSEFPGQDAFYRAGCGGSDRFVDNEDGTITDTCTGLMWTATTQDANGDLMFTFEDMVTWKEALKFCEDRDLAGHTDWRLPNRRELESLAEFTDNNNGVNNRFSLVAPHLYWSSTTDITSPGSAWFVEFGQGGSFVDSTTKFATFHVLCVRTAN